VRGPYYSDDLNNSGPIIIGFDQSRRLSAIGLKITEMILVRADEVIE